MGYTECEDALRLFRTGGVCCLLISEQGFFPPTLRHIQEVIRRQSFYTAIAYDLPRDYPDKSGDAMLSGIGRYVDRIGKTGKFGRRCVSIALVSDEDVGGLKAHRGVDHGEPPSMHQKGAYQKCLVTVTEIGEYCNCMIEECPMNVGDCIIMNM